MTLPLHKIDMAVFTMCNSEGQYNYTRLDMLTRIDRFNNDEDLPPKSSVNKNILKECYKQMCT